jgi:predicted XRE-type DNA-binding protein
MKASNSRKEKRKIGVVEGTGNVFEDIGFSKREAAELLVKAELTRQIYNRIKSLGLTQLQASRRLGISQPDVSKLVNARFTGYSTDRLIALLNSLNVDVEIVVRPRNSASSGLCGTVRVREMALSA